MSHPSNRDASNDTANANILSNPLPELRAALTANQFGISSYTIHANADEGGCRTYPITPEQLAEVREEVRRSGRSSARARAACSVRLVDEEGRVEIVLDQRGWTVENIFSPTPTPTPTPSLAVPTRLNHFLHKTYESLETLLIAVSPGYVEAMNREIWKRFERHDQEDA